MSDVLKIMICSRALAPPHRRAGECFHLMRRMWMKTPAGYGLALAQSFEQQWQIYGLYSNFASFSSCHFLRIQVQRRPWGEAWEEWKSLCTRNPKLGSLHQVRAKRTSYCLLSLLQCIMSDETSFLLLRLDVRVRIWYTQHESMTCLVLMVQAAGAGVIVWIFSWLTLGFCIINFI